MLASYLAIRIVEDGAAPEAITGLVPEALAWDQGHENFDSSLSTISPALIYTIGQADFAEDRAKTDFGFRLLDYLQACASNATAASNMHQRQLYENHAEFRELVSRIESDKRRYYADVEIAYTTDVELPQRGGGQRSVPTMICRLPPQSHLLKHWARSIGAPSSQPAVPYECLVVPYDPVGDSSSGIEEHFRRVVISVNGNSDIYLGEIGRHLELREQQERERRGIVQQGDARFPEISNSPDPWYDGRGHNYTIIDSPRGGTLLSYQQILACAFPTSEA